MNSINNVTNAGDKRNREMEGNMHALNLSFIELTKVYWSKSVREVERKPPKEKGKGAPGWLRR